MNQGSPEDGIHVLIVGAGLGGLLLAQGLKKHGISFSIFESERSAAVYRAREWGMSIQWALPLLSDLLPEHIHERLQSASVDPHYTFPDTGNIMPVYNAQTGERLKDIPRVKMLRVSRQKFRALLTEGIAIQYNKSFRSLRTLEDGPAVTAQFSDGSSAVGTLVVGADGANSIVRDAVFAGGEGQAQHIPYGAWNLHVCYHDAETALAIRKALSPISAICVHPKGHWLWLSIQDVPDPDKPETWVFQLQWTRKLEEGKEDISHITLAQLKAQAAKDFAEPFRTAWTNIPDNTPLPTNNISIWHPLPIPDDLFKGKVVLLGDAAHAMSFHRGQGLNHGIADAAKLVEMLVAAREGRKVSVELAVLEYEGEMMKRAGEEVAVSRVNTEMMHDWERLRGSPFMRRGGDRNG
ncbi:FAD-dependent monooxygenase phnB [Fulvia fulva]|nr:FAD-dependent monooxygenase phnB [Fulvia fulva]KAK4609730.1 FAD-dependent monooxygenase phnB [Fulvia fulva]WPV37703.1 FAD-dependent monooxygenase phnB [Fulvia fulva]